MDDDIVWSNILAKDSHKCINPVADVMKTLHNEILLPTQRLESCLNGFCLNERIMGAQVPCESRNESCDQISRFFGKDKVCEWSFIEFGQGQSGGFWGEIITGSY